MNTSHLSQNGISGRVAQGMLWVMMSTAVAKSAGLGSQFVLGWILTPDHFAVYAIAVSLSGLVGSFREGGVGKILMQRGEEYHRIAPSMLTVCLIFVTSAAAVTVAVAPWAESFYGTPNLRGLMWVIAVAMVLGAPKVILSSKAAIDHKFADIAKISCASSIVRHGSMSLLALAGFGPYSFVLPMVFVSIYEWIAFRTLIGPLPSPSMGSRKDSADLWSASGWLALMSLAVAIIQSGDYLVVGKLGDAHMLGIYFFGFTTAGAVALLLTSSLHSVLMPAFSKLKGDRRRQRHAYARAVRLLLLVTAPLCVGVTLAVPYVVPVLWNGKWDEAIVVIQLLLIALISRILAPVGGAVVESQGRWRLRNIMVWSDAIGTLGAAALGTYTGSVIGLATVMAIYRALVGLVNCSVGAVTVGLRIDLLYRELVPSVVVVTVSGGAAACVSLWASTILPPPLSALLIGLTYVILLGLGGYLVLRKQVFEAIELIRSRRDNVEA